jgi:hypothetical protein
MFPAHTAGHRRPSHADAVPGSAATGIGLTVRSRWQSARELVRSQFAADDEVPGRRGLQLCLGLIWLLDAALQFQPFMFRPSFVTTVIEPAAAGDPGFVTTSVNWASQLMLHQVAFFNAIFATAQLLISVGLFFRRTTKPALALSIVWALMVWWFGESLGGILVGLSPLAGVPGAVLLYALIAVLVWPSSAGPAGQLTSVASAGPAGAAAAKLAWFVLWGSFAHFLLLPANRAPGAISHVLTDNEGQPGWLSAVMNSLARAAGHHGVEISVLLAVLCAGIALAMLARPLIRPALVLAGAVGILFWIAEGLGGVFTGRGTDPNTGPLLILLAACYAPHHTRQATLDRP